jgi:hypothetical protein
MSKGKPYAEHTKVSVFISKAELEVMFGRHRATLKAALAAFLKHGIECEDVYIKNDGADLVFGWDDRHGARALSLRPGLTNSEIENEIDRALENGFVPLLPSPRLQ